MDSHQPTRRAGAGERRVSFRRDSSVNSADDDVMERLSSDDGDQILFINKKDVIAERDSESSTEIMQTEEGGLSDQEQTNIQEMIAKTVQPIVTRRYAQGESSESDEESSQNQKDLEKEMKFKTILHMAKKNLSFELEYIQAVCEYLESGGFPEQQNRKKKKKNTTDNPLLDFSSFNDSMDTIDELSTVKSEQKNKSKNNEKDLEFLRLKKDFLFRTFKKLELLKKEYLKEGV